MTTMALMRSMATRGAQWATGATSHLLGTASQVSRSSFSTSSKQDGPSSNDRTFHVTFSERGAILNLTVRTNEHTTDLDYLRGCVAEEVGRTFPHVGKQSRHLQVLHGEGKLLETDDALRELADRTDGAVDLRLYFPSWARDGVCHGISMKSRGE